MELAGCPEEFIMACTNFKLGCRSLKPVQVSLGHEDGGKVDLYCPWGVKVMWRNVCTSKNQDGSKTYLDARKGQRKAWVLGLPFLTHSSL